MAQLWEHGECCRMGVDWEAEPHSLKPWEQGKKSDFILSTAEGNVF